MNERDDTETTAAGTEVSGDIRRAAAPHTPAGATDGQSAWEAYSFACMKCGHGWEQAYEIRHASYSDGTPYVVYYADGARVPSPLTKPRCENCDGHLVRIMRSGRVSDAATHLHH